jgi:hypothetical protein
VEALRTIWREEEPKFSGTWEHFSRSCVNPKPTRQTIPIGFGYSGPSGTRRAARHADEWCPIDAILAGQEGSPQQSSNFTATSKPAAVTRLQSPSPSSFGDGSPVNHRLIGSSPIETSASPAPSFALQHLHCMTVTPLRRLDEFASVL